VSGVPAAVAIWALAGAGPDAQQTGGTLNLSRDMVRLGIAAQNLLPNNPSLDATPLFQAALDYAKSRRISIVTVDTGNYYLLTPDPRLPWRYASLVQISDMTIDLAGSTIYAATGYIQAFGLIDCERVTLTNFQLDYVNPPYTHVRITAVDAPNRRVSYTPTGEWPDPVIFNSDEAPAGSQTPEYWGAVFRDGAFVPATTRMRIRRPIISGTLDFVQDGTPWTQPAALQVSNPGDTMVIASRGGNAPITVIRGDSIVLSRIRLFGSSNSAVNVDQVSNSIIEHVRVEPRPSGGLLGSNGDGIHIRSSRRNNHIRHNFVTRTLDDGIAMDSLDVATVMQRSGARQLRVRRWLYYRFPDGTPLNFVDPVSTAELIGATVISQSPPDSSNPIVNGEVELTFDRDLPTLPENAGVVYGTPSMRGEGSTIEDNRVTEITGRGIWLAGLRGVAVRRNQLGQSSSAGIVLLQFTRDIGNSGPPGHDLTIESNVLQGNVGPMAQESGTQQAIAAIVVGSTNNNNYTFARNPTNSSVTIRSNYVADSGRAGIWVGQVTNGAVYDNVVVRWFRRPEMLVWGLTRDDESWVRDDFDESIAVRFSGSVELVNNQVGLNSTLSGAVTLSPDSVKAPRGAAAGTINVGVHVPGLIWTATSDAPWLTVTWGDSGTGDGPIGYSISTNETNQVRTATITVAGVAFRVTQSGL
jgi:hypothetical protein